MHKRFKTMGLIKCVDCGKDISDEASKCPYCSASTEKFLLEKLAKAKKDNSTSIWCIRLGVIGIIITLIFAIASFNQYLEYIELMEVKTKWGLKISEDIESARSIFPSILWSCGTVLFVGLITYGNKLSKSSEKEIAESKELLNTKFGHSIDFAVDGSPLFAKILNTIWFIGLVFFLILFLIGVVVSINE